MQPRGRPVTATIEGVRRVLAPRHSEAAIIRGSAGERRPVSYALWRLYPCPDASLLSIPRRCPPLCPFLCVHWLCLASCASSSSLPLSPSFSCCPPPQPSSSVCPVMVSSLWGPAYRGLGGYFRKMGELAIAPNNYPFMIGAVSSFVLIASIPVSGQHSTHSQCTPHHTTPHHTTPHHTTPHHTTPHHTTPHHTPSTALH